MRCIVIRASNSSVELRAERGTLRGLVENGDIVELVGAEPEVVGAIEPDPEPDYLEDVD